ARRLHPPYQGRGRDADALPRAEGRSAGAGERARRGADAARGDAEADPGEASGREGGEAGDAGKGGEGKEVGLTDSPPLPPAAAPRPATAAGEVSGASSAQDDWAAAFGRRSRRWVRSPPGWECGAGRSAGGTPSPCPRPAGRGSPGRWRPAISPA